MSHPACPHLAKLFALYYLLISANTVCSQGYYNYNSQYANNAVLIEVGGGIGLMNCLTDLGGNKGKGKKFIKDINWKNAQVCGNVYIGAVIKDAFGIRMDACFGTVKAYDSILSKNKTASGGRYYRNLSFKSKLSEFSLIGELHPLLLKDYGTDGPPRLSPYLLAGIARFSFNPQTYFEGKWVDLQPLRLEGQGFKEYKNRPAYRLTATSYPIGLGLRYELGSLFFIRFEITHRFTSTDYLDDVSQGAYIDPALFYSYLSPANAALATQLYDRHQEINPNYQPIAGDIRGQSRNKDAYFTFSLKTAILLGRKPIH